jgi:hypothetical protein
MKTARLLVILLNFALIGILALAGVKYFQKDGLFVNHQLPLILEPEKYRDTGPAKPEGPSCTEYLNAITPLAKPTVVQSKAADTTPEDIVIIPQLAVEIRGVVLDKEDPSKSGAHLVAGGVPRFIAIGDSQKISDSMPYWLREIVETKPDQEYKLFFEDKNGKRSQAIYRKQ